MAYSLWVPPATSWVSRTTGGPSELLIWLMMTGQLGRWLTAGMQLSVVGPQNPERRISALPTDPNCWGLWLIRLVIAARSRRVRCCRDQLPRVFPASRPMLWGAFRHGPTDYRVHVHVVPAASPEVTALRGFRDALRSDPLLRRRYAALKRAIVAGGPVDPVAFSKAKHDWIAATLDQLGLTSGRQRRLYEDAPSLQRTRQAC
jgi:GrpB-like predicted nucleotidyltransferase (UPF0157 family)